MSLNTSPETSSLREIINKHASILSGIDLSLLERDIQNLETSVMDHNVTIEVAIETLARNCNDKILVDPLYSILAGNLMMDNIKKTVPQSFSKSTMMLKNILNEDYYNFVMANAGDLDKMIDESRDFLFDMFSVATLKKSYLAHTKRDDKSYNAETPQYMYLRVAVYLHFPDLERIKNTYDSLSKGSYSHATPTLFNSGMKKPQLASCFLNTISDDMSSITKSWHDHGLISQNSGGIGADFSRLRHSEIGQHGFSRGIVPWIKVTNQILQTVDQCFGPDTFVYTSKGPKKMRDIKPGDELVISNGTFGKVKKQLRYDLGEDVVLHKFKIKHYIEPVIVAGCHPMLSFRSTKGESFSKVQKRLEAGSLVPEYTDISQLDENYFVAIPIPTVTVDIDGMTLDDCRMYGILLGDGYADANKNEFKVYLNDRTKADTCKFVEEYLNMRGINFWSSLSDTACRSYGWTSNPRTFPFTREMLYNSKKEKRMISSMMNLPVEKCMQIFKGLMETDGSYRTGGEIQIEQTSKSLRDFGTKFSRILIEGLRYILLKAGIPTSGYIRDRVGSISYLKRGDQIVTQKIIYSLRIPKTDKVCEILGLTKGMHDHPSQKPQYFIHDDKIWSRVVSNDIISDEEKESLGISQIIDLEMEKKYDDPEDSANYLTCIGQAHNGGKRKGSGTVYIRDWHIDVEDFVSLRDDGPDEIRAKDIFLGLMVSDLFMKRVRNDEKWSLFCPNKAKGLTEVWGIEFDMKYKSYEDQNLFSKQIRARDLWIHILNTQIKKGMPFILYMDPINFKSNQKHSGIVRQSNLCVSGDTMILTDQGHFPIGNIEGQNVNVWNGEEWSNVKIRKTGTNQNLLTIIFSNGAELSCTPEHKFYIQETYHSKTQVEVQAKDLIEGQKLIKWDIPVVEPKNPKKFVDPYTHGFYCGDGTNYFREGKRVPIVCLYGEKMKLLEYINYKSKGADLGNRITVHLQNNIPEKFEVPMNASIDTRIKWLAGYSDADGTISRNGTNESLQIGSINKDFLLKVRLMVMSLGVDSKVRLMRGHSNAMLPDGNGGQKEYTCQPMYRLLISSSGLQKLLDLGFSPYRLKIERRDIQRNAVQFVTIEKITKGPQNVDTFCFTEPKKHMGVFNGILTGQCTEIALTTNDKEIASCTLASVSLNRCVDQTDQGNVFNFERLEALTAELVRNLNQIIDRNYYPSEIPEIKFSNMKHRPLGIGVQGLADTFALLDMSWVIKNPEWEGKYEENKYIISPEAKRLNKLIFETMYYAAVNESANLAQIHGPYPAFEGSPASQGLFQFDMWDEEDYILQIPDVGLGSPVKPDTIKGVYSTGPSRYSPEQWETLRNKMKAGLRNSTLTSLMPTASSAHILGNQESMEPFTELTYSRTVLSGYFAIANKHLVKDMKALRLWTDKNVKMIISDNSLQNITVHESDARHPRLEYLKLKYLTVFEIPQSVLIDMAADRSRFICQTSSQNCFMARPNKSKLHAYHFNAWSRRLKTGMYYLRQKALSDPINFTSDSVLIPKRNAAGANAGACDNMSDDGVCMACNV